MTFSQNTKFVRNKALFAGGAVVNVSGTANISQSSFENNEAGDLGGAIVNAASYTDDVTLNITDSSFIGNKTTNAGSRGGAIYNTDFAFDHSGIINIIAQNENVLFAGNTDSTGSNAIYNEAQNTGAAIYLNANGDKKITFNDCIDGSSVNIDKQNIYINKANGSAPIDGTIEFNNTVKNNTVNLYNGTLMFGSAGNFDNSIVFNVNGGKISLQNGSIGNTNLGNLNLTGNVDLLIDGNFSDKTLDTITADGFNANGKFIIRPNYLMSYTFVNTFDYTNAAGVRISSDPLNSIQIAPGIKFIGNLSNGWQPYLGVQMVWNIMDRAKFRANNVELPNMSVDPYIQYGVGVQKKIGDRFTGFGQAMVRNGGRNGIALQFGFRWSL